MKPLVLGIALLTFVPASSAQSGYYVFSPPDGPDPREMTIEAALDSALAVALIQPDVIWTVRQAGLDGLTHRNRLKALVELYSEPLDERGINALEALWRAGEPREYFEDFVRDWRNRPRHATNAAWILARDPNSEMVAVMTEVPLLEIDLGYDLPDVGYAFNAALSNVRYAEFLDSLSLEWQFYSLLTDWFDIVDRCVVREPTPLIPYPFEVAFGRTVDELDPRALWAQAEFGRRAASHPAEALEAIVSFKPSRNVQHLCSREAAPPDIGAVFAEYAVDKTFPDGPPSTVPQCEGLAATVYVAADGTIVGGARDGQPYAGLLRGTTGPDVMVGTDGADVLRGSAGDDLLCGLSGDDELRGDNGNDTLYGGPGDDDLLAGSGDDRAWGGPGDDVFRGAAGDDRAWGETGNDRLLGNGGRDTLHGGDGDDRLEGGGGDDTLRGEAGQDDARGGGGTDACDAETETSCETDPD